MVISYTHSPGYGKREPRQLPRQKRYPALRPLPEELLVAIPHMGTESMSELPYTICDVIQRFLPCEQHIMRELDGPRVHI